MSRFVLIIVFLCLTTTAIAQIILNKTTGFDSTTLIGSTGENVVDACIQKINNIPSLQGLIGNDFGFMKRIALVETEFGDLTGLEPQGGIWQVSRTIATTLLNAPSSINNIVSIIAAAFGSDVVDFSTMDFRVPLKSAVAARVFLEIQIQSGQQYPGSVNEQADWWTTNYKFGSNLEQSFITAVESFESINRCIVPQLDIWFLVDGSGSIGAANFQSSLDFVNQTAASFEISTDRVRTALMIYSSSTIIRSLLSKHQSNREFSDIVLNTTYPHGGTMTGAAINEIANIGFNVSNGGRSLEQGVPRILVALTDGQSGDLVQEPSMKIKEMGVTVFAVGVGAGFDQNEINTIASEPSSDYAFEFSQFNSLASVLRDRISVQACTVPAVIPSNSTASLSLTSQTTFYSQVELPSNGSVELRYKVIGAQSTGIVYLSESVANPNSAFCDASFQVNEGVTTVFYNSIDNNNHTDIDRGVLYVAFQTACSNPIDLEFTAVPSYVKAVETQKKEKKKSEKKRKNTHLQSAGSKSRSVFGLSPSLTAVLIFWMLFS